MKTVVVLLCLAVWERAETIHNIGYAIVDAVNNQVLCEQSSPTAVCDGIDPLYSVASLPSANLSVYSVGDPYNYQVVRDYRNEIWATNNFPPQVIVNDDGSVSYAPPPVAVVAYSELDVNITQYIPNPFGSQGALIDVRTVQEQSDGWHDPPTVPVPVPFQNVDIYPGPLEIPSTIQYGDQIPVTFRWHTVAVAVDVDHGGSGLSYSDGEDVLAISLSPAAVPEPSTFWLASAALVSWAIAVSRHKKSPAAMKRRGS